MGFKFEANDRTVADGVRRIAAEQIDAALSEIGDADGGVASAKAIHSVRKRGKRLRALLKAVRHSFPDYDRENEALRRAARGLSDMRDAEVLAETFESVATELATDRDIEPLRQLVVGKAAGVKALVDTAGALAEFRSEFKAVRARIDRWRFQREDFRALRKGIERIHRRARRDMDAVADKGNAEDFHDWRKAVKAHFYHLCLLREVSPALLAGQRGLANELGEILGKQHDVSVLLGALDGELHATHPFRLVLQRREDQLGKHAIALGAELFAEPTSPFVKRVKAYWQNWRDKGNT